MDEEDQQIRRLDLDAPLLSVRRIPSRPAAAGPVGTPGLVPFTWEQAPGLPKPPPGPASPDPIREAGHGDDDDELSDALSPVDDPSEPSPDTLRRFRKDPQLGELMMGRFLAAAKAVATGPLQGSSRKAGRDGGYGCGRERKRVPLPFQHQPEFVSKNGGGRVDCDDGDGVGGRHFLMACRQIPRSFLLSPAGCLESRGALHQDEVEHSWDAVYTHKLGQENLLLREDGSKLTSESNRLTYWSESQSPDGSSSYYGKGWKSGSFDSYEKSGACNLDRTPSHGNLQGSGSMSSSADRILYVDSVQPVGTPYSMSSSVDEIGEANNVVVVEGCRVQPECNIPEPGLLSCSDGQHCEEMDGSCLGESGSKDSLMTSENDKEKSVTSLALSLLPPPLPSSPSESWLQRTLPSVSSKNPPPRSLLGIQVQYRRQPSRTLSKDSKWITDVKSSKADSRQIRSTEVLK
ncbi:uncharacterized protein M6B38_130690 [Iris pallida]|uniref:Uncharacterized protein n=1 Tax=Iris pallida TaxID=29817 RepID=A0AAX6G0V6_IRIPA|nr:uncharacterized protein M6B38_130690 [Iris pallida]